MIYFEGSHTLLKGPGKTTSWEFIYLSIYLPIYNTLPTSYNADEMDEPWYRAP